ncbi:MAG: glycosyltransferase family 2 protein [bacterium]|nr:glycosyltransferase family 2 protein [bacterium]
MKESASSPVITVVIPTLNEETTIVSCLERIGAGIGADSTTEVIVSDGGSSDTTVELVRGVARVKLVRGDSGRGQQLNRGAREASADRFLFLHADCRLPVSWYGEVMAALDQPEVALACFPLRTVSSGHSTTGRLGRLWLRTLDFRSRGLRLPYGDQGFALRKSTFETLGGFPDIPLMEDLAFARTCRRLGRIQVMASEIETTARRMEGQPVRARLMMLVFPMFFRLGVSPKRLARWYGNMR